MRGDDDLVGEESVDVLKRCGVRCGRAIAIVVGAGYLSAAVVAAFRIADLPAFLGSVRWPLPVASAAQLGAFGALALAGAFMHPAAMLASSLAPLAYLLGNYESESAVAPLVALSAVALIFAYRKTGGGIRSLGTARLVILGLAVAAMFAGIIAMQAPTKTLYWSRVREPSGRVALQSYEVDQFCETLLTAPKDVDQIDAGCETVVGARRAKYVVGYAAATVVLGFAAVAGVPKPRPKIETMTTQ